MIDETVRTMGEGTTFAARVAAILACNRIAPSKDGARPLLLAVIAEAGAARPIAACVRKQGALEIAGNRRPTKYELLRTSNYEATAQHVQGGAATILQWHLPDVFALDPGTRGDAESADAAEDDDAESAGASAPPFVVMPPACDFAREVAALGDAAEATVEWLLTRTAALSGGLQAVADGREPSGYTSEARFDPTHAYHAGYRADEARAKVAVTRGGLCEAVAWAPLVAAYVDRRTTAPMLRDLRFQALLLMTLVESGAASWSSSFAGGWGDTWRGSYSSEAVRADGLGSLGYVERPFLCAAKGPGYLESIVVECVRGYEAAVRGGRQEHARAVIAAREERRTKLAAAVKAATKRR